ncbi:hypothetical protein [Lacrimispora xylanisolvens]
MKQGKSLFLTGDSGEGKTTLLSVSEAISGCYRRIFFPTAGE